MFVDMYEVHRVCTDLLLRHLTWGFECAKESHIEAIAHKDSPTDGFANTVVSWLSGLYGGRGGPNYLGIWNIEGKPRGIRSKK